MHEFNNWDVLIFFYLFLHLRSKIKKNLKIKRSLKGNKTYDKRKNKKLCETWTCGKQWKGLGTKIVLCMIWTFNLRGKENI